MRTKRLRALVLFTLVFALLLTGCWDAEDIEGREILTLVIVDRSEKGYAFTVEYSIPSGAKDGEKGSSSFQFTQSEGDSLVAARDGLDAKLNRPIYLGAVHAVVLTGQHADEGIAEYMFRLRDINDYRKIVDILVTDEPLDAFTKLKAPQGMGGVGKSIEDTMTSLIQQGRMFDANLAAVLDAVTGPCECFLLPNVKISDDNIELSGFSIFCGGKRVGTIPEKRSRGVLLLKVQKPKLSYVVPYDTGTATVAVEMRKRKIKPVYENRQIYFHLTFSFGAELSNYSNDIPVTQALHDQIQENLRTMIFDELAEAILTSQKKYESDYLGFFSAFRIAYPTEVRAMNWSDEYPDAKIDIAIDVDFDSTGSLDYIPRTE